MIIKILTTNIVYWQGQKAKDNTFDTTSNRNIDFQRFEDKSIKQSRITIIKTTDE